jgi:hypothetical protein
MSVTVGDIKLIIDGSHKFDSFIQKISTPDKLSKDEIFKILFDGIILPLTGKSKDTFDTYIKKLSLVFDFNGDGCFDENDLEYFKTQDVPQIIYSCIQVIKTLYVVSENVFQVHLSKDNVIDISYRIIVYTLFLPLSENENFRAFIRKPNGQTILSSILDTLYIAVSTSAVVSNTVEEAVDYIANELNCCGCCNKCKVISKKIIEFGKKFDNAVTVLIKIKSDSQIKTIINLKEQIKTITNK